MKISDLREKVQQRYPEGRTLRQGDDVQCDNCDEEGVLTDDIFFEIEPGICVCGWCLGDIEYDVAPEKCQGCGKERSMNRGNEVHPGVYYCHLCLRSVYA